jgi:DNA-binding NarL/FixJ family response regulator
MVDALHPIKSSSYRGPASEHSPSREPVTGSGHLAKRSDVARVRTRHGKPSNFLIIDDEHVDAERLTATLHVLFGYQVAIRCTSSLQAAVESLADGHPSITFLDDILKPSDDASRSMPELRRAGYDGPIIVVSGALTPSRRARLIADGAVDVIHKDDVDSVRVAEAVDRALSSDAPPCGK